MANSQKLLRRESSGTESLVRQSLERIATVLLRAGLDFPSAEQLLRRAFISVASRIATPKDRKATQSQIAALAGVSRLEVRKVIGGSSRIGAFATEANSRIGRLIAGWNKDPAFSSRRGGPRALTVRGSSSEFAALVRKYGRDVTKKTLKVQLLALGFAKERDGRIILIRSTLSARRSAAASADLRFIVSQLESIDFELGRREYSNRRVSIQARERKSAEAMKRIALTRLDTVINSLESMSTGAISSKRKNRTRAQPHRLIVSTTVAVESGEP